MKWFVLFFSVIVGITTSDVIGLSPAQWQYWFNIFTITLVGSAAPFIFEYQERTK
jgi:hypothetical protein